MLYCFGVMVLSCSCGCFVIMLGIPVLEHVISEGEEKKDCLGHNKLAYMAKGVESKVMKLETV